MYKQALQRFLVTPITGSWIDTRHQECEIHDDILLSKRNRKGLCFSLKPQWPHHTISYLNWLVYKDIYLKSDSWMLSTQISFFSESREIKSGWKTQKDANDPCLWTEWLLLWCLTQMFKGRCDCHPCMVPGFWRRRAGAPLALSQEHQ